VYELEQLLPVPLSLANDCAELTAGTTIGILSTRGAVLDLEEVQKLCSSISSRGHGMVGPSTFLSPSQVLLLGQGDTLERFEQEMQGHLPADVTLRRKPNRWPPGLFPCYRTSCLFPFGISPARHPGAALGEPRPVSGRAVEAPDRGKSHEPEAQASITSSSSLAPRVRMPCTRTRSASEVATGSYSSSHATALSSSDAWANS